jgi:hypothetical protein
VRLSGTRFGMWTDSSRRFRLGLVPAGRYELAISAIGYMSIRDSIAIGTDGLAIAASLSRPPSEHRDCITGLIRPPNEELKLTALASDAAGSLRSPAWLMVRRSLTPAR